VGAAFEKHVTRLDVAVDQVGAVSGGQPFSNLPADPHYLCRINRANLVQPLL
jgi:hypothetical protein